jgi:hypothetical protein
MSVTIDEFSPQFMPTQETCHTVSTRRHHTCLSVVCTVCFCLKWVNMMLSVPVPWARRCVGYHFSPRCAEQLASVVSTVTSPVWTGSSR